MIRFIEGRVISLENQGLVILSAGLGYLVHTTKKIASLPGDTISLHTYLAVRETALDLYGFLNREELSMFELLLSIPKIGPKSAMQILDQADLSLLLESINLQDYEHLSKLSGMGKKTAEKVVLALKGKVDHFTNQGRNDGMTSSIYQDAFDTLITLGFNPANIKQVLDSLPTEDSTSTLVKKALRDLK